MLHYPDAKTTLEYEHAYYPVMNRGRGRLAIFHYNAYYQAFLETLFEAYCTPPAFVSGKVMIPSSRSTFSHSKVNCSFCRRPVPFEVSP